MRGLIRNGNVLHVPALAEHDHAGDAADGAFVVVHVAGHRPGLVQIPLGHLPGAVGVDDEQPVAAELGGVLALEPVAHVVGLAGVVHHDEQDGLAAEEGFGLLGRILKRILRVGLNRFDVQPE
ncbi:MAG TPA: hypothetical protein VFA26_21280 [Gemmataceae bacterium]|nr:hypothetical protein [Gemmataceae bacterium]